MQVRAAMIYCFNSQTVLSVCPAKMLYTHNPSKYSKASAIHLKILYKKVMCLWGEDFDDLPVSWGLPRRAVLFLVEIYSSFFAGSVLITISSLVLGFSWIFFYYLICFSFSYLIHLLARSPFIDSQLLSAKLLWHHPVSVLIPNNAVLLSEALQSTENNYLILLWSEKKNNFKQQFHYS